jgi:hypothetical protein
LDQGPPRRLGDLHRIACQKHADEVDLTACLEEVDAATNGKEPDAVFQLSDFEPTRLPVVTGGESGEQEVAE